MQMQPILILSALLLVGTEFGFSHNHGSLQSAQNFTEIHFTWFLFEIYMLLKPEVFYSHGHKVSILGLLFQLG